MHPIPSALALLGEESGASPFRLHPDRPGTGWAVAAGGQVWVWAEGLRPLPAAGPGEPYVYEVWTASPDGTVACAGAAAPSPAGTLLATLPAPGVPAAVLVCARARGQADRPAAVVLAGRLYATGLAAPAAGAALEPAPGLAPVAHPDPGPGAASIPSAAPAAGQPGPAPVSASTPDPAGAGTGHRSAPESVPAVRDGAGLDSPGPWGPGGAVPNRPACDPARSPEPLAPTPVLPAAGAEPAPDALTELEVPPLGDPPWVTNPEPDPLPTDALDGCCNAAAAPVAGAPLATGAPGPEPPCPPPPVAAASPPADAAPRPGAAAPPTVDVAPLPAPAPAPQASPGAAAPPPSGPAAGPGVAGQPPAPTAPLLPPGCEPLTSATVHLQGQGACPGATGAAQIQFAPGSVLITLRGLPRPEHLGQSQQTGRPYNVYRVWLQSSATREVRLLGPATRIWEHTYRLQVPEGVPLRRYDTILVTAEDRAAGPHPSGLLVLSGRYRWYQPQV